MPTPQPDPQWPARGANDGEEFAQARPYSPPAYLPAPVPPPPSAPSAYTGAGAAVRNWIRIPIERPFWTYALLGVLVGIFVLMTVLGGSLDATDNADFLVAWGAKVNSRVAFGGQWWLLITATFLHAGILHIATNGYALYIIGIELEAFFGRARFLAVYAISGLAGSVASFAFSPFNVPGVGASGAIFGLIGALAVYFGLYRKLFGKRGNMQFWNIILIMVLNIGFGFSGILPIDNSAHLGGLAAGALAGYILCPRYKLGEWETFNVRPLRNVNTGPLPWAATAVTALVVVFIFIVLLLLFRGNYIIPTYAHPG